MKKLTNKTRLNLDRTTLRPLIDTDLRQVAGGATYPGGPSCGCKPTICPK